VGQIYWIASYPKSGNTWVRAFLTTLILGSAEPDYLNRVSGFAPDDNLGPFFQPFLKVPIHKATLEELAAARPHAHRAMAAASEGVVFLKTHSMVARHLGAPTITADASAGAIYIVRNPLDIVVSYSEFRNRSIDQTIALLNANGRILPRPAFGSYNISGSWTEHVESWTRHAHDALAVVRYEDMLESPAPTFRRLVRFLQMEVGEPAVDAAIERTSFAALKSAEQQGGFGERPTLTGRFFRAGTSGQWKSRLSIEQISRVVRANAEQMRRFGYWEADFDALSPPVGSEDLSSARRQGSPTNFAG
jgi:hypothetical protein